MRCARGDILAELGRARQAMLDLDRVTLAERPATRAARGLALAKLGDRSAADLEVDDAVAEAPWNGSVLLHAARAKALNGERMPRKTWLGARSTRLIPGSRPITGRSLFSWPATSTENPRSS